MGESQVHWDLCVGGSHVLWDFCVQSVIYFRYQIALPKVRQNHQKGSGFICHASFCFPSILSITKEGKVCLNVVSFLLCCTSYCSASLVQLSPYHYSLALANRGCQWWPHKTDHGPSVPGHTHRCLMALKMLTHRCLMAWKGIQTDVWWPNNMLEWVILRGTAVGICITNLLTTLVTKLETSVHHTQPSRAILPITAFGDQNAWIRSMESLQVQISLIYSEKSIGGSVQGPSVHSCPEV